ncbi:MAG: hypothetical protein ACJAZX_001408, partial [Rickettsiales bacterium]
MPDSTSDAIFGLGLRHPHHQHVLQNTPKVDFFEIHTENFIADGGASLDFLDKISDNYPLSFHCVGLSLGSAGGLDKKHLKNTKKLLDRFNPILFSDHLSWSSSPEQGASNDLLPILYTKSALKVFCDNVKRAQDFFGREILIENPSAYLEFEESKISEIDFLNEISVKADCGILLDINNVFVSAKNFGFSPEKYLENINISKIREIHLAGHSVVKYGDQEIRIDTHSTNTCDEVLELYKNFKQKNNLKIPVLV